MTTKTECPVKVGETTRLGTTVVAIKQGRTADEWVVLHVASATSISIQQYITHRVYGTPGQVDFISGGYHDDFESAVEEWRER